MDTVFVQRLLSRYNLAAALILSAIFLGPLAKPASADIGGLVGLINSYRQSNNLGTLSEDQKLVNAACWLANDMAKTGNFNHTDSNGRTMETRLNSFGVSGSMAENIFWTSANSAASSVFTAWKNSPGHNANMLGSVYTRIGIGRANVNGRWYWAADFANGSATFVTSQCTISATPPPKPVTKPPSPPAVKVTPTPAPIIVATPQTEVVIATPSASETNLVIATKSTSISAKVVEIENNQPKALSVKSLVKGSFLTVSFIVYLILFGFIFWQLFHHFRLPPIEHEEEI